MAVLAGHNEGLGELVGDWLRRADDGGERDLGRAAEQAGRAAEEAAGARSAAAAREAHKCQGGERDGCDTP